MSNVNHSKVIENRSSDESKKNKEITTTILINKCLLVMTIKSLVNCTNGQKGLIYYTQTKELYIREIKNLYKLSGSSGTRPAPMKPNGLKS